MTMCKLLDNYYFCARILGILYFCVHLRKDLIHSFIQTKVLFRVIKYKVPLHFPCYIVDAKVRKVLKIWKK